MTDIQRDIQMPSRVVKNGNSKNKGPFSGGPNDITVFNSFYSKIGDCTAKLYMVTMDVVET